MWKQSPAPSAADHAAAPRTPLACTESHPLADPTCCNRRNQMQKELFLFTARRETFPLRQPSGNARGSAPAALPTGCSAQALPTSPREPGSCRRVRNMAGLRFLWSSPPPPRPPPIPCFPAISRRRAGLMAGWSRSRERPQLRAVHGLFVCVPSTKIDTCVRAIQRK